MLCRDVQLRKLSGEPIYNQEVEEILEGIETADDGTTFEIAGGTVPVERVEGWIEDCDELARKFSNWCRRSALTGDPRDLEDYLGAPEGLLDVRWQRVDKRAYVLTAATAAVRGEVPPGQEVLRRIEFEDELHLSGIQNRWLYPSRRRLLEEAGGFDSALPSKSYYGPRDSETVRGKHARPREQISRPPIGKIDEMANATSDLDLKWRESPPTATAVGTLLNAATSSYLSGEYDAEAVFAAFREAVRKWSKPYLDKWKIGRGNAQLRNRIVSRLAVVEMVKLEGQIMEAVSRRAFEFEERRRSLTDDLLEKLKDGTMCRP